MQIKPNKSEQAKIDKKCAKDNLIFGGKYKHPNGLVTFAFRNNKHNAK